MKDSILMLAVLIVILFSVVFTGTLELVNTLEEKRHNQTMEDLQAKHFKNIEEMVKDRLTE